MATIAEALAQAIQHHQAGQLPQAEQLYRQILQVEPANAPALHFLGIMAHQLGRQEQALNFLRQAVELAPREASFHNNLGLVQQSLGQLKEASGSFRRALHLRPDYSEAYVNLANALRGGGRLDEAIASYREVLRLRPDDAEAHNNLGTALCERGRLEEGMARFRQALRLRPDFFGVHNNLGNALRERGQVDEAIASYRQALHLRPDFAEAHNNLGIALRDRGQLEEGMACYREALRLRPDFAEAHNNLGNAFRDAGLLDQALACCQQALHLRPDFADAHSNLGTLLKDQGRMEEAIACYRRARELKPDDPGLHSNLLYALHFSAHYDSRAIYQEHRRWNERHAQPLASCIQPHGNDRAPKRRLRVGYVSPDFCEHPVGRFLLPLLEAHDRENFAVFCYASMRGTDALTERCRRQAEVWRDVPGLSDEQLAQTIRQDQIDILVDLTMHMANRNRLLVFARKPAPVQVTYLAYCGTTGLTTIDYRLTDPYLDPPGQEEGCYSERSIHLPETYWCYRPPGQAPPVNPLPALQTGHVTFGCLNNFCKVSQPTLSAWSHLLQRLPEARLLLHVKAGSHRERVCALLAQQHVPSDRLTFLDMAPLADYFRAYERMDVALDPFPYGGGTTTCDALWMGVPVVSLAGQTAVGRAGLSILSNVGLADLVAHDAEEYVRLAVELADNLARLSRLRATMRERMLASPLMDAPRFARNVEAAYRKMWQAWCAERVP